MNPHLNTQINQISNINILFKFVALGDLNSIRMDLRNDISNKNLKKIVDRMNGIFSKNKDYIKKIISYKKKSLSQIDKYKIVYSRIFETDQRMVIGLGDESVLEVSITLDHLTGIPFIPASSLKGVIRTAFFWRVFQKLKLDKSEILNFQKKIEDKLNLEYPEILEMQILFGTQNLKGCTIFTDTYPTEDIFNMSDIFELDITNCHYMSYYANPWEVIPGDWENPNPVFFFTLRKGVKFEINIFFDTNRWNYTKENLQRVIQDKREDWNYICSRIEQWMNKEEWDDLVGEALSLYGVGAKTRLGYGIFNKI